MVRKLLLSLICFCLSEVSVPAQDLAPSVKAGYSFYPSRDFKDTVGHYGHQRFHLGVTVPLFRSIGVQNDDVKFYQVSLGINGSVDRATISFLPATPTFLFSNLSLNGIYKPSMKSFWLTKLSVSDFEDATTIDNPTPRLNGFALYRRTVNENFFYMIGGAYTFLFAKRTPIPVFGLGWRFANHASFTVVLPFSLNYKFGKRGEQFSLFTRFNGGFSNFNNSYFANASDNIVFRKREFTLGINKKIKLSDQFQLFAEAGLLLARRITFSKDITRDDNKIIFESKVKPGPYVSVGVRYRFRKYNNLDLDQFDVVY